MGRTETTEELTDYVAGVSLAYRLSGRAGPFRVAEGGWVVTPDDDVTVITVTGRFEPLNAAVGLLSVNSQGVSRFGPRVGPWPTS